MKKPPSAPSFYSARCGLAGAEGQAYAFKGGDKKQREHKTAADVQTQRSRVEKRKTLQYVKYRHRHERKCGREFQKAVPRHRAHPRQKGFFQLVVGSEKLQHARRQQSREGQRTGRHTRRGAHRVDAKARHEARQHINPTRRAVTKDQQHKNIGHRGGVAEQVDVVENQRLRDDQHDEPEAASQRGVKHRGSL